MTYYPPSSQDGLVREALRTLLGSDVAEEGEDLDETLAFAARDLVEAVYAMPPSKRPKGWDERPQGEGMAMPEALERADLWSLLDWALWGNGMADVFREPLADKMVAALSQEEREKAERLIARWRDVKGESAAKQAQEEIKMLRKTVARLNRTISGESE